MTRDDLYQRYDGMVPEEMKRDYYGRAFLQAAERNFAKRCRELVQAICAWRIIKRYPDEIKFEMLHNLNYALLTARGKAVEALALSCRPSLTAAPINMA